MFKPWVMCGNHQKVDNAEAAERLALVEPQLSPEKVSSLFDKRHAELSPVTFLHARVSLEKKE